MKAGADIGGTSVKVGIFDGERLVRKTSFGFDFFGRADECIKAVKSAVINMLEEEGLGFSSLESVGFSVPGSVDSEGERIAAAHNLGFYDVPIGEIVRKEFPGIAVSVYNDADSAALGELHFGALKGCRTAVLLTLGTGLGGALIIDGRLFRGGLGRGTEPGHFIIDPDGDSCTCGNRGCAETKCSATFLIKKSAYKEAKEVFDRAERGEKHSSELIDEYVDCLSSYIAGLINLLDPEKVCLGGGVSKNGRWFYSILKEAVSRKTYNPLICEIVPAELGNDAGMMGAL